MRDELVKRLDEIIDAAFDERLNDAWTALRAELVAERCENCRWWGIPIERAAHTRQRRSCRELALRTGRNFCCSHCEKES